MMSVLQQYNEILFFNVFDDFSNVTVFESDVHYLEALSALLINC